MFKNHWMMVVDNPEQVDSIAKNAANHHLQTLYKIGIYGKEKQHEVYLIGKFTDYWRFKNEFKKKN